MTNTCVIDGKKYIEVDQIKINDKTYAYLVNEKDEYDFLVKIIEGEYYTAVKSKNEFDLAIMHFLKKHKDEIK